MGPPDRAWPSRPEGIVHRLPPWGRMVLAGALTVVAFLQASPLALGATALVWCGLYAAANLGWRALARDGFLVVLQAPAVFLVYIWRQGLCGVEPALVISIRFALALLPGLWLQRTTRIFDTAQVLGRMLPPRLAFVLAVSLRFLPILARDAREISLLQRLRGARVGARDLLCPWRWPEACHCLAVPLLMRALRLADQLAVAARQRGIDERREDSFAAGGSLVRAAMAAKPDDAARTTSVHRLPNQ